MIKIFLNIFVLLSFILSNSNLFFYQHYCGDELHGSAFFHTISCECGDQYNSINTDNWILSKDDGCCQETIIYAHNPMPFYAVQLIFTIFLVFLSVLFYNKLFFHLLSFIRTLFYKFIKRTCRQFFHLLLHCLVVRTVVLRN